MKQQIIKKKKKKKGNCPLSVVDSQKSNVC